MSKPSTPFSDPAGTWNARFAAEHYLYGTAPNAYLERHAQRFAAGARVLCVADGEGRNSVWLARRGVRVEAFDIAATGVDKARRLAAAAGVEVGFEVADWANWRWPQAAYDGVVAVFVQFAGPAERERLFERMVAALRPGGTLLLQGYATRQMAYGTGGPGRESHLYTEPQLRAAFAALQVDELVDYDADLAEGTQHVGRSALIGLVARRPA